MYKDSVYFHDAPMRTLSPLTPENGKFVWDIVIADRKERLLGRQWRRWSSATTCSWALPVTSITFPEC